MKFLSNIFSKIPRFLLNKYALLLVVFIVFITFFDHNNLISRWKTRSRIKGMEKEIKYYKNEIGNNKKKMSEMRTSSETLEKYAREQYFLKKDSEDIYIINEDDEEK